MYRTVVTIYTAQWSLYVPHIGHYMYRTVVTICTAHWSLYVPHSGHYMYRTVVTICTAYWSLYVPHSGHYMYRTMVTICTTSLTFNNSTFCPHTVFMCFVWISEQTVIISLYSINWPVFVTETESVYCAVRTGSLKCTSDKCPSIKKPQTRPAAPNDTAMLQNTQTNFTHRNSRNFQTNWSTTGPQK